jgi:2-phosphosulfolactate phosphatase
MESARGAKRILIGAFVNLSAISAALSGSPRVTVICSGTDRMVTSEDVLFAGALSEALGLAPDAPALDDSARIARAWWETVSAQIKSGSTTLETQFRLSHGGRNLVKLGYDDDIRFCADVDRVPVVPVLDEAGWLIGLRCGIPGDCQSAWTTGQRAR